MSERLDKEIRRKARKLAGKEQEKLVPQFKAFVNTELCLFDRFILACRIIGRRF